MDNNEAIQQIDAIIARLEALRETLAASEQPFPKDAAERYAKGICLVCGKPLSVHPITGEPWTGRMRTIRGNHESCYKTLRREIEDGVLTDAQATARGLQAPRAPGGPKPERNPARHRIRQASEDIAASKVNAATQLEKSKKKLKEFRETKKNAEE